MVCSRDHSLFENHLLQDVEAGGAHGCMLEVCAATQNISTECTGTPAGSSARPFRKLSSMRKLVPAR